MSNQVNDPETIARQARFETKYLRKRFPLRSAGASTDRKKSDQNLATPSTATTTQRTCGSNETEVKVGEGLDNAALERLAVEELLQEAARAKARAEVGGPSEWSKKPARVNKRFMVNSLLQTESQNKRRKAGTPITKE
ncbi:uncharacterized protein LOC124198493 [Daphnia pulex]|uniref:uncharacterized protein LOC124198493 n=1 Tax=Daphnia pulex TaxID=6669 RepID=UPI001EE0050D|nr:uncharacterized protein LOC124198493 [Daphnia pulex]